MSTIKSESVTEREKKIESSYYRYSVELVCLIKDEEDYLDLTEYLSTTEIHYNYDNTVFPFLVVDLILTKQLLLKIQNNRNDILFYLKISRFNSDGATLNDFYTEMFKNIAFKAIDIPKSVVEANSSLNENGEDSIADNIPQHELKIFLFKQEHLFFNKKLNSNIFSNVTMADVLLYLINKNFSSTQMKFNIGKLDNQKYYEQVIIPPLSFVKSINYLQRIYGLFNNGIQTFFDFQKCYIMDKTKVIPGKNLKLTIPRVILELYSPRDKSIVGYDSLNKTVIDTENNLYIVRTMTTPRLINSDNSSKELIGENLKILSNSQKNSSHINCIDMTFETGLNDPRRPKESIRWNPYSHPMIESEYKSDISSLFNLIEIIIHDTDLEVFNINRTFELIDKNDSFNIELNGTWKIKNLKFFISPEGVSGKSKVSAKVLFRKIINQE